MSRFIDKLKQISQAVSQPLGFKATPSISEKPRMQLIASLAQVEAGQLVDSLAGADAGLVRIAELGAGAETLKNLCQAASDIPWGGWLGDIGRGGTKQLAKAGCDFVVFSASNTPLSALQHDKVGKVLEVAPSLSEGLLRAINELPIDAVLIAGEQEKVYSLTWHHLMLFQRFADLISKPLLVSIPSVITASELQVIWGAGVSGVVTEVEAKQAGERLAAIRQDIDRLTPPAIHKRGEAKALLPHIGGVANAATEDEEEFQD